jgi:hypothetical protein
MRALLAAILRVFAAILWVPRVENHRSAGDLISAMKLRFWEIFFLFAEAG